MPDLQNQLQSLESMVSVMKGVLKGCRRQRSQWHYNLLHILDILQLQFLVPPVIDIFDEVNLAKFHAPNFDSS